MSGKGANNAPSDKQMRKMSGPWQPLQDPYQQLIPQIQNQKKWKYGPSAVAGMDPNVQAGINQGVNLAQQPVQGLQGATDFAARAAGGEFMGGPGMDQLAATAQGGVNNPAYQSMLNNMNMANQGSGGMEYAQGVAGGKYLGSNPYIDDVVSSSVRNANEELLPALEGRMAMSGRSGSNAESRGQGEIARKLAETASNIRYGDYQNERGLQQQAGLALPGMLGTEMNTRMGAAGAVGDEAYNQQAARAGATGQLANIRNMQAGQALDAGNQLATNYNNQFLGADRMIGYGGLQQDQAQRQAEEAHNRFQYNQGAQSDRINRQLGQYGQIAGTTNPALANQAYAQSLNRPSSFQQGVGNLLGLAGAGAQIGSMFFDPTGTSARVLGQFGQQAQGGMGMQ